MQQNKTPKETRPCPKFLCTASTSSPVQIISVSSSSTKIRRKGSLKQQAPSEQKLEKFTTKRESMPYLALDFTAPSHQPVTGTTLKVKTAGRTKKSGHGATLKRSTQMKVTCKDLSKKQGRNTRSTSKKLQNWKRNAETSGNNSINPEKKKEHKEKTYGGPGSKGTSVDSKKNLRTRTSSSVVHQSHTQPQQ